MSSDDANYGLLAQLFGGETFVLGFEAGTLWERMKREDHITQTIHADNEAQLRHFAQKTGHALTITPLDATWAVVELQRPTGVEWRNATMICAICGHEWVATYPAKATALQCSKCDHMNPAPEVDDDA